jgi:hypothetical protein
MPSLTAKDRVSLCLFSFTDGRRCRTPRTARHPHFCFYHAQKESQSQAAEKLSDDLAYFFSGDYLSACDVNTALGRLIPAVIRGEIKPRLARTVAYMFQTLLQSTHLAQHEYINAFGTDGWRQAVHSSVNANQDYLFPPETAATPPPPPSAQVPAQSPARPAPVGPGLARPDSSIRPSPADTEAALNIARSLFPRRPNPTPAQPNAPLATTICHPERSEGSCLDSHPSTTDETQHPSISTPLVTPSPNPAPAQTAHPTVHTPPPPTAPTRPTTPTRDPYAVHFDHSHRLLIDGKPW